jgi:8-oxo-dGTP pyrophosphatase MutT (NUDIX family)
MADPRTGAEEPARQIAALPIRRDGRGRMRVLMVTSRDTGRWVTPKGWLIDGEKPWRAAEIEALEEAGAVGFIASAPLGFYHYDKRLKDGECLRCRVTVYPLMVEKLRRRWKERGERKRRWFRPGEAARMVDEAELAALLRDLAGEAAGQPSAGNPEKAS